MPDIIEKSSVFGPADPDPFAGLVASGRGDGAADAVSRGGERQEINPRLTRTRLTRKRARKTSRKKRQRETTRRASVSRDGKRARVRQKKIAPSTNVGTGKPGRYSCKKTVFNPKRKANPAWLAAIAKSRISPENLGRVRRQCTKQKRDALTGAARRCRNIAMDASLDAQTCFQHSDRDARARNRKWKRAGANPVARAWHRLADDYRKRVTPEMRETPIFRALDDIFFRPSFAWPLRARLIDAWQTPAWPQTVRDVRVLMDAKRAARKSKAEMEIENARRMAHRWKAVENGKAETQRDNARHA